MTRAEQFAEIYVRYRLGDYRIWYQRRRDEFVEAQQQANLIAGVLMIGAGLASATAAAGIAPKTVLAVLAAALPAIAGLAQAMQRLYAYEHLAKLYDRAARALIGLGPQPTIAGASDEDSVASLAAYVTKAEEVFTRELGAQLDAYKAVKPDGGRDAN